MKSKEYFWALGFRGKAARLNPAKAYLEIKRLKEQNGGGISPAQLIEEAKNKKSYFHGVFVWEDELAAAEYRLEQARNILRSLRVRIIVKGGKPEEHRLFIHVNDRENENAYYPVGMVMDNSSWREIALREALSLLHGVQARYSYLSELQPIFKEVQKLKKKVAPKKDLA